VYAGGVHNAPLVTGTGVIAWLPEAGGGLIVSQDNGMTWQPQRGPSVGNPPTNLVGLPGGSIATLGNEFLVVSDDLGVSWRPIGPRLPYVANGVTYSPGRQAFYVWRFDCDAAGDNAVSPDAILQLDVIVPPG
jgi:hypothetical protein